MKERIRNWGRVSKNQVLNLSKKYLPGYYIISHSIKTRERVTSMPEQLLFLAKQKAGNYALPDFLYL
jgi:hypothetical protein